MALVSKIRVGIVGVGNWALNGPLRVLALSPHYEITAVYSQRPDAASSVARKYGIPYVAGTLDELVWRPDVDLVLVLTTGAQHEEGVRAAIAAGKDVYCEWPLTPTAATTAGLVELGRTAGVRTILGLQARFAPAFRYVKDLIAGGYVGRVRSVRMAVSVSIFGQPRGRDQRWSVFPENFMGVTSIFGAHMMDPLFSIVGRPIEISALLVNQWPEVTIVETGETIATDVPDQLMLFGLLAGGALMSVHIEGGKHHGTGVQIVVTGDDGDLTITNPSAFGNADEHYEITGAKRDESTMDVLPVPVSYALAPLAELPTFVQQLAELFEVHARDIANETYTVTTFEDALYMANETYTVTTFEDALSMQRLLDVAALSSRTGRRLIVTY
jgi:predicted dehydrogenase